MYNPRFPSVDTPTAMMTKAMRTTVNHHPLVIKHKDDSLYYPDEYRRPALFPTSDYISQMELPLARHDQPAAAFTTRFVVKKSNKQQNPSTRAPMLCCSWAPDGRRLATGCQSGEITLWNEMQYNFATIMQAHDAPVRDMTWSHDRNWLVSCDDQGVVKYWQSSMNMVKAFQAHKQPVQGLTFAPEDSMFATCSDDQMITVWDFASSQEQVQLSGHGWDVKCVQWHPSKALIVSGGKDNLIKLWDPRAGDAVATLHGHNNTVSQLKWNKNGYYFASAARDQLAKLWDIRVMKDVRSFKSHKKDVTSLAWHPVHEHVLATGDFGGNIYFWLTYEEMHQASILGAHQQSVWNMEYHPLGHALTSVSNDSTVRFWSRNRPGDEMTDQYNAIHLPEPARKDALRDLVTHMVNVRDAHRVGNVPALFEGYDIQSLFDEDQKKDVVNDTAMDVDGVDEDDLKERSDIPGLFERPVPPVPRSLKQPPAPSQEARSRAAPRDARPLPPAEREGRGVSRFGDLRGPPPPSSPSGHGPPPSFPPQHQHHHGPPLHDRGTPPMPHRDRHHRDDRGPPPPSHRVQRGHPPSGWDQRGRPPPARDDHRGGGRDDHRGRGPPARGFDDHRGGPPPRRGGFDDRGPPLRGGFDDRRGGDRRGGFDDRRGPPLRGPPPSRGRPFNRPPRQHEDREEQARRYEAERKRK